MFIDIALILGNRGHKLLTTVSRKKEITEGV